MNNDNTLIPKYRFPEFKNNGSWKISSLSDKIDYERPDKYIVKNTNYLSKGTPVLTANKSFILGYTDENEGIYEDNLPVIIFDDFTVDNKYVDFPFKVKSSAIKILKNKNEDDSLKFFYELMSQIKFEAKEHKRYYISAYQKIEVPVPTNPSEQQKIAECLSSLDDVIAGHEEKLKALEEHKKGLMQNLFPQEGETQPKYRFPEFENDGDWVERKLGDIANRITLKNKNSQITQIFTNSAEHGIVNQRDFFDKDIANQSNIEGYYIVEPGDFVYNPRVSSFAPVGPIAKNNKNYVGAVSPLYTVFRFINPINDFYVYYFKTKHWFNAIRKIANTGARFDRMSITASQFMEIEVLMTSIKEQQKIASVLSSVDELIVAQREKIEALKEHKKGLMQGLFPKIES